MEAIKQVSLFPASSSCMLINRKQQQNFISALNKQAASITGVMKAEMARLLAAQRLNNSLSQKLTRLNREQKQAKQEKTPAAKQVQQLRLEI